MSDEAGRTNHGEVQPSSPSEALPVLGYQTPGTDRPPRARIRIEQVGGGLKITELPSAWKEVWRGEARSAVLGSLLLAFIATGFSYVTEILPHWPRRVLWAIFLLSILSGWKQWRRAKRLRSMPAIVEVRDGLLSAMTPAGRRYVWRLSELSGISASRPDWMSNWKGALVIGGLGRSCRLFEHHEYKEVYNLARLLRRTVGMSEIDFSEPAPRRQWEAESSQANSDLAEAFPISSDAEHDSKERDVAPLTLPPIGYFERARRKLSKSYNQFGCGLTALFFSMLFVGMYVVVIKLLEFIVISLLLGWGAFGRGIRFVPHREFLLNNGQTLSFGFRLLYEAIWMTLTVAWFFVCLLVTCAVLWIWQKVQRMRGRHV